MAKITNSSNMLGGVLFNSHLETGIRALIILDAAYPMSIDLSKMTWLDHLVVHTGDIDGPASLHPNVPQLSGEMLVRRRLIEDSLTLMRRLHLIITVPNEHGITYQATEEAYPLIELMRTPYAKELKSRAQWIVENICQLDDEAMHTIIAGRLGRWNIEFQEKNDLSGLTQ